MPETYFSYTEECGWGLPENPPPVIKTHSWAAPLPKGYRAMFTFGDVVDSVLSFYKVWRATRAGDETAMLMAEESLHHDVFGFTKMFTTWMRGDSRPVLCVRYERMWDRVQEIEEFAGLKCLLPSYRQRVTQCQNYPPELIAQIEAGYAGLIKAVKQAPDLRIWESR